MNGKNFPTLEYENKHWNDGYLVIGIDEVGRGALAGPVGVGAVCFDPKLNGELLKLGINDSKKLSPIKRQEVAKIMKPYILASSVAFSEVNVINKQGIVAAVNQAIRKTVLEIRSQLPPTLPIHLLLDAFNVRHIPAIGLQNQTAIIKGDEKSISIAAASILAKVKRDLLMTDLSTRYLPYHWHQNKGYGTKGHLEALRQFGPTVSHRALFIRNVV